MHPRSSGAAPLEEEAHDARRIRRERPLLLEPSTNLRSLFRILLYLQFNRVVRSTST